MSAFFYVDTFSIFEYKIFKILKKAISPFFICLFIFAGCTNKKLDFAERAIQDSIPIYLDLAFQDTVPYEARLSYNEKAFQLISNQKNDSLHRLNLFKVANRYFNLNNREKFHEISKIVLQKSIVSKDTLNVAKAYSYIGEYYLGKIINADSSFAYFKKASKLYSKLNDKANLGAVYINIAILQNKVGDYVGSELSAIKALEILKGTQEKYNIYEANNIIAVVAYYQRDYDRCLQYHDKALNVANSNYLPKEFHPKASTFNNIGTVYHAKKEYKKAIRYYEKGLNEKDLFIHKAQVYANLLDNLAYSKFCLKDYLQLPELFYDSLKITDSLNMFPESNLIRIHLSEFYFTKKDTVKAMKYAIEALNRSRQVKEMQGVLESLRNLALVDISRASYYRKEYIKLNDSLQIEERRMQNKFARIEFETDEIILEKDRAVNQKWTVLWISISMILGGFLFYVFRMQQSKQRELLLLRSRQKANEEIYQLILNQQQKFDEGREKEKKRIAKELHDGIMNRLASIRFNLFVLENKTDPATIEHCLNQAAQIEEVEKEVSSIAQDLSYDIFSSKNSYPEFLKTAVAEFATVASLKAQVVIDNAIDWEAIDSLKKLNIYRILQESLHNIRKHAQASRVQISFKKNNSLLEIEISDDGIGFSPQDNTSGQGIKNIESRAEEMRADLKINTLMGKGTVIKIILPLETNSN